MDTCTTCPGAQFRGRPLSLDGPPTRGVLSTRPSLFAPKRTSTDVPMYRCAEAPDNRCTDASMHGSARRRRRAAVDVS